MFNAKLCVLLGYMMFAMFNVHACYMYHDSGGGPQGVIGGRVVVGGRVTPSYGAKTCSPPPFRLIPLKINTHLKDF